MTSSPDDFRPRRQRNGLPRWVKWLLAAVPISGAFAGTARLAGNVETRTHAESTFVRRDSMAMYRQAMSSQRYDDSLISAGALREMFHMVSGLDSSDRCHRGMTRYCR